MNKKLIMRRTFTFDVNAFDMQINVSPLELKQVKSRIYNSLLERSITPHHSVTRWKSNYIYFKRKRA